MAHTESQGVLTVTSPPGLPITLPPGSVTAQGLVHVSDGRGQHLSVGPRRQRLSKAPQ